MKTLTFSINPKSFLLGALTVAGLLLIVNFTPANTGQPDPTLIDTRRFQVVMGEHETVILDTKTGRFILSPKYIGQPRWVNGDFEELQSRKK